MFNSGLGRKLGIHNQIDWAKAVYSHLKSRFQVPRKQKVFCVGNNKTGTTSIALALKEHGYMLGNQLKAELLNRAYANGDFDKIVAYCKTAEAFQDIPFSWPETYKYLDMAYPNSKFILTVRDNSEQWYNSIVKFHSKLFGKGKTPTVDDFKRADYVYKGWMWENAQTLHGFTEAQDPYEKEVLIKSYEKHNKEVMEYFKDRPNDLLVINLSDKGSYQKFCSFLGVKSDRTNFPWENRTSEINVK